MTTATTEAHAALLAAAKEFGLKLKDTSEPRDGYIRANGLRLHYLDWGGTGTPILFLHGGNQTAHTWDLVCLQLRSQYRCIALDQRGHGESEAPKENNDPMPFSQREDVRGAIEALGLEKLVLVGMSMGGLNTLAYSSRYPQRLLAITIVDVGPTIQRTGFEETGKFLQEKRTFASLDEALEHAHQFNPRRPLAHLRYSLMHALKRQDDGTWTWRYAGAGMRDAQDRKAQAEKVLATYAKLWEWVPRIPCPALVVHGGESNVLTRADADKLAATLPKGRAITIAGAGHTVQGDQPKAFAAALRAFLKEVL